MTETVYEDANRPVLDGGNALPRVAKTAERKNRYHKQAEDDLAPLLGVRAEDTFQGAAFIKMPNKYIGKGGNKITVRIPSQNRGGQEEYLGFRRSQTFSDDEKDLAELYMATLHEVANLIDEEDLPAKNGFSFWPMLSSTLVEQSIAKFLAKGQQRELFSTVMEVLNHLRTSATSTYEGVAISQNFIVMPKPSPGPHSEETVVSKDEQIKPEVPIFSGIPLNEYVSRAKKSWTPNLGASRGTAVYVTHDGLVVAIKALPFVQTETSADATGETNKVTDNSPYLWPESLARMAHATKEPGVIGFSVIGGGDISVMSDGEVRFIHRRGSWRAIPSNLKGQKWGGVTPAPAVRRAILESLIDASFEKHGATIAVLRSNKRDQFLAACRAEGGEAPLVDPNHLWSQIGGAGLGKGKKSHHVEPHGIDIRRELLWHGLGRPAEGRSEIGFADLTRSQRLELMSMDGATILDNKGTILASGVIVKVRGGGSGGRAGAALALAEYGCAFKVSQDGEVLLYNEGLHSEKDETNRVNRIVNRFG